MSIDSNNIVIVGNSSDDPFAIDLAFSMGQAEDIADLISMKTFANSEFCPRFISDEEDFSCIGRRLTGMKVVIVSTTSPVVSRQNLAMRNLLIARAAKENGAAHVMLVEPDLYYSAQDRGPTADLGETVGKREDSDLKKFDGQPFTAKLYAQMLKLAGVDSVLTVHNHSYSVQKMFSEVFEGNLHNLIPYDIYCDYVKEMHKRLNLPKAKFILLDKERSGEREVEIKLHSQSEATFEQIDGHDIVLFDDMVRTGSTVVKSCEVLKEIHPGKTVFAVSHFYASEEGREKMASDAIDEILTLNTLPTVLNRDVQGRLRRKLVVLKIERWLATKLSQILEVKNPREDSLYQIDMSSTNPRFIRKIYASDQLPELHPK
jgi:ribose-phosphate pyrophosphokinase